MCGAKQSVQKPFKTGEYLVNIVQGPVGGRSEAGDYRGREGERAQAQAIVLGDVPCLACLAEHIVELRSKTK